MCLQPSPVCSIRIAHPATSDRGHNVQMASAKGILGGGGPASSSRRPQPHLPKRGSAGGALVGQRDFGPRGLLPGHCGSAAFPNPSRSAVRKGRHPGLREAGAVSLHHSRRRAALPWLRVRWRESHSSPGPRSGSAAKALRSLFGARRSLAEGEMIDARVRSNR